MDCTGWLSEGAAVVCAAGLGWLAAVMPGVAVDWKNAVVGADSGGRADATPEAQPTAAVSVIPAAKRIIMRLNSFMADILFNH